MYNPVDADVAVELRQIAGGDAVIYSDDEKLKPYSFDESTKHDEEMQKMPEAVVKAHSAREISQVMNLANRRKIPVTPRGAGSGLSGGAVPVCGGIVISTEEMNGIIEIDAQNLTATVEPGVITNDLNKRALQEGLFFAGYPLSLETCSIGGNVAHNAGGGRAVKYGVTGHHVLGLEAVLPTGEIVSYGGKMFKDVSGYSMVQLMLGSEGTLGIITKIIVRLLPIPTARSVLLVAFEELDAALAVVPGILTGMQATPSAIEFMDRGCIEITYNFLGKKKPHDDCGALLIIELDGDDQEAVRRKTLEIGEACLGQGALDAFAAETPGEQEEIWKVRMTCPEVVQNLGRGGFSEDVTVPVSKISELVNHVYGLGGRYGIITLMLGHAGDGNIHVYVGKMFDMPPEKWKETVPLFLSDLYTRVKEMGGTITGEHGIGTKRKAYLPMFMSEDEINAMKKIKAAFDPNNILNPGKKFDM